MTGKPKNHKQGSWRITQELTKEVLRGPGNGVYSPTCITEALRVLQLGASGKTRTELDELLGCHEKATTVAEDYGFELPEWKELNDYKATSSVGLWLDERSRPSDGFVEESLVAGLSPRVADFTDPMVSDEISVWINEGTGGLLRPQIQLSPLSRSCIASAIYFKDAWFRSFEVEDTKPMVFHAADGDVETDFMSKRSGAIAEQKDGFLTFSLPLASGAKVVFALPDEDVSLFDLLERSALYEAFANPSGYDPLDSRTELYIPKFESESILNGFEHSLQTLGFSTAPAPDISNMTGFQKTPMEIVQGAKISVDEIGVEAAAYTLITLCLGAPNFNPPKPRKVVLDRPFAYAIVSRTGLPLFVGVLNNPAQK